MGLPETTASPPHLYPQTLQLKLYQAFIFSIPILFSIILFLLFYLFYLKRRISNASSPAPPTLPTRSINQPSQTPMSEGGLKGMTQEVKLPVILFGEDSAMKESQCCCCICLGEFEVKEELHQLPPCTHIFHTHCITHWLRSNSTCPMCRSPVVITAAKISSNRPPAASSPASVPDLNQNTPRHPRTNDDQNEELGTGGLLGRSDCSSREEEVVITILHGSSSNSL